MSPQELEQMVVKKTNKYVYFSNKTHMSHSDFHRYKQSLRDEYAIIHHKEYADSVRVITQSLQEKEKLESMLETIEEDILHLHYKIGRKEHDWEKSFREQVTETENLKHKLISHARKLYSNLFELPILKEFEEKEGIKFIIQKNYKTDKHRFGFDPYKLGANFHSTLSDFYRENDWGTINGGWLKVIENKVILYAQSGDYGVYDNETAIEAVKIIFPDKEIISHAGEKWEKVAAICGLPL